MTITQRFSAFALDDVDGLAIDFSPAMATGDTLTSPAVTVTGGFTVGTPRIGTVNATTNEFTVDAAGTWVYVLVTATDLGNSWEATFTATISGGRLLHRTERVSVVAARS